jgi:hypothetical protein
MELIYQVSLSSDLPRVQCIILRNAVLSHRNYSVHYELFKLCFVGVHLVPYRPYSI